MAVNPFSFWASDEFLFFHVQDPFHLAIFSFYHCQCIHRGSTYCNGHEHNNIIDLGIDYRFSEGCLTYN